MKKNLLDATHAYCPLCKSIEKIKISTMEPTITDEGLECLSSDVVCSECLVCLTTFFCEVTPA